MRKFQLAKIMELLQTLKEANGELRGQSSSAALTNLLADIQDFALEIGHYIESVAGEGAKTISLLEAYCETLYMAHVDSNVASHYDKLKKQLYAIETAARSELKRDRIEVVFFPYQLSMFDSMETVYLAAKEDPACDAYVVPIPWYDKKPDQTLGSEHYDGDQYPEHIPVTSWKDYDVEARHPDIIFIHAPYDEINFISTVHPDYYAKRLRDLCDMLCYIPYFVSFDHIDEHFCNSPACIYSHKTFLQSEKMRAAYLKSFDKSFSTRFGKLKDKLVALGSPKFDRVLSTRREDCALPPQWESKIKGKKTVLFNTTIGSILQHRELYLTKLRQVVSEFSKRGDIALWWRPHPLSEQTYDSMRPALAKEYRGIVADFKEKCLDTALPWVYDDTPDLNRAIAVCDYYFGDFSSLVALWGVTGRPAFLQNVELPSIRTQLCFQMLAKDDDGNYWGFNKNGEGLFEVNYEAKTARLAAMSGVVPLTWGRRINSESRFRYICCAGDYVVCFPWFSSFIMVFNRRTGGTEIIPLEPKYIESPEISDGYLIYRVFVFQGKAQCFCYNAKAVVVFDMNSHTVSYDTAFYDKLEAEANTGNAKMLPSFIDEYSGADDVLFRVIDCDKLFSYNLTTQDFEAVASSPLLSKCYKCSYDGRDFWLITKNDKLTKWNRLSNEITEYSFPSRASIPQDNNAFLGLLNCGEALLIIPGIAREALIFDKKTGTFSVCEQLPVPEDKECKIFKFTLGKAGDKDILNAHDRKMYEFDRASGQVSPILFSMDGESAKKIALDYLAKIGSDDKPGDYGFITVEEDLGGVGAILDALAEADVPPMERDTELFEYLSENKDGTAGRNIYKYVRSEMKL